MQFYTNHGNVKNLCLMERWASVLGGAALVSYGVKKRSIAGSLLAIVGGDLVYLGATGSSMFYDAWNKAIPRGAPGESTVIPYDEGIRVDKAITIGLAPEELYSFWRSLENLPRFMRHLHSVTRIDDRRSHWIVQGPTGKTVEWDAEIINDEPNELIAWSSLPGSDVDSAGSVHFKPAPDGQGTEVKVELQYNPPGGALGAIFAKLMGQDPATQIKEDLRRMKQMLETGEIATTEGQSTGKEAATRREPSRARRAAGNAGDSVEAASEESFPASDPPSWTAPKEELVS